MNLREQPINGDVTHELSSSARDKLSRVGTANIANALLRRGFRNAYLLGCVGAWSLHPVQVDIAKRVFSPDPADVVHAQRVIEAMGDGTGAVLLDGKMEDDASVKQCHVIVALARQLAERDAELASLYGFAS